MSAKITLWGLESFLNASNKSVFDLLNVPAGMDKDILTDEIFLEANEFGVVYQNADFMREAVGKWSNKNASVFSHWWEVWNAEYNPLYNFDRKEIYTDNDTAINKNLGKSYNTESNSHTVSNISKIDSTNENKVSAYDATDYANKDKSETGTTNENRGSDNTVNKGKTANDDSTMTTRGSRHNGHLFGNIGVTQTTELLTNEDIFRNEYNPYKLITDLFIVDFLIGVY